MLNQPASSVEEVRPPCFDAAAALERLDGDRDLFTMLVEVFHQDSTELYERLSTSLAAGNLPEAERAAHSLKGLAANFDAKDAAEAALRIEEMTRQRTVTGIEPRLHALAARLQELRAALATWQA